MVPLIEQIDDSLEMNQTEFGVEDKTEDNNYITDILDANGIETGIDLSTIIADDSSDK